ncbi:polysaccharide deacetylase family protein, partial [Bacillus pumilus]|uniref:polysaccharide deacetylase family protein n=1 Tax=Bacillus pumilus TaxID=1408 RepID=UPI0011A95C09
NYTNPFPILNHYPINPTIFIIHQSIPPPNHLTHQQIHQIIKNPLSIHTHTTHHLHLNPLSNHHHQHQLKPSNTFFHQPFSHPTTILTYPLPPYNQHTLNLPKQPRYQI